MKQINTILGIICFPLLSLAFPGTNYLLDTTFTCNNLVHVSLDDNCTALITPDLILEGVNGGFNEYSVSIEDALGNPVPNPVTGAYLGELLIVTVTHDPTGNSCWGELIVEDKTAPQIFCFNATIECYQDPNIVPEPPAQDNCDANPDVNMIDETIDASNLCNGVMITRTFIAIDNIGNESGPCQQIIITTLPSLPDFPEDTTWSCGDYLAYPNVVNATPLTDSIATTGSGLPDVAIGPYCPYNVGHSDVTLAGCGESFKIIRNWTVFNWCTGQVITQDINGDDNVQIVDVLDTLPPAILMDPFTVSINIAGVHPEECKSEGFLPGAQVTEECGTWTVSIFTPVGEAIYINGTDGANGGFIPSPGLSLGFHSIVYLAIDECGNAGNLVVEIEVVDDTAPVPVCDEITEVALTIDGLATVQADVFDDGSHDNCCLDYFEVRKMDSLCGDPQELIFGPSVTFCCDEVSQNPNQVVLRVFDCAGNYNECMVDVNVQDKITPTLISCPPSHTIDCDFYLDSLEIPLAIEDFTVLNQFGNPIFQDNCQLLFEEISVTENLTPCGEGTLTRNWVVTDPGFNPSVTCTQVIFVDHVSDWVVEFPEDVTLTCGDTLPDAGQPEIFFESCELIAISYEDQYFNVVPDACFKIKRTWTVINWCVVGPEVDDEVVEDPETVLLSDCNEDGVFGERVFQDGLNLDNLDPNAFLRGAQPDGFITYEQHIKVMDNTPPIVNCQPQLEVCIEESDCWTSVELPEPEVIDCSQNLTITADGDLGIGLGPFEEVLPGNYTMIYVVTDNCGNSNACQTDLTVVDCKPPTPFCLNGLVVELEQDATRKIWAFNFDAGSFDNCSDNLKLSFSPDTTDVSRILDCFDLGQVIISLWVTDEAGNQDFCETFVVVQDNLGSCMGPPLISGVVENENGMGISDATVLLSGDGNNSFLTGSDGLFEFTDLQEEGDYTVTPGKDINYLNGVTTFDLLLISKHILGTVVLDSPYKIIAADANKSNSVTTLDMVQIRRLILHIDTAFADNDSWRFIDKNFVFQFPGNPFLSDFPEVIDFNNLTGEDNKADFIGLKVGDVNGNADPLNLVASDDRNGNGVFELKIMDKEVIGNEEFTIFFISEKPVLGYQFTLNFDKEKLDFTGLEEGMAKSRNFGFTKVHEGAINVSWDDIGINEKTRFDKKDLFGLTFRAKEDGRVSDWLSVNSRFTLAEAYDVNLEKLGVILKIEKPGFALFQNTPNPFRGQTKVGFNLDEKSIATFKVWDASGKVIHSVSDEFPGGHNKVSFNFETIPAGVLYYRLSTAKQSETRKMILIK